MMDAAVYQTWVDEAGAHMRIKLLRLLRCVSGHCFLSDVT